MVLVMVSTLGTRVIVAPYGAPAQRALTDFVDEAKLESPLAPVTIVVPSALVGITVRRGLAASPHGSRRGIVAVDAIGLRALAERLGARRLAATRSRALHPIEAAATCRAILRARPGWFAPAAQHAATADALVAAFDELRELDATALDALAQRGPRGADVVRLAREYWNATATTSSDHDMLVAAARAVRDGDHVVDEVGTIVLYAPRRFTASESDLLRALVERDRLRIVLTVTGRDDADIPARELADHLRGLGVAVPAWPDGPDADAAVADVIRAADPTDEARAAVREIVAYLRGGGAPERVAVVSRVRSPYALTVHDQLASFDILHSAPGALRLSQTLTGRTLLALLEWPRDDYRRDALMRVLRAAPVRDASGAYVRADQWDSVARRAGVVAGLDQWRSRLATSRRHRLERIERLVDDDESPGSDWRLVAHDELLAFVEQLVLDTDPTDRRTWRAWAHWARDLIERYLGDEHAVAGWADDDRRSHVAVLDTLDELGRLDAIAAPRDADEFFDALEHALRGSTGRVGRFGQGVFVGSLADVVGADLDLLVIVGLSEGTFPPRPRIDAVLDDNDRAAVGLHAAGNTIAEERRDAWAAVASARRTVVTFPVADPRAERARHPAPFVLELVSERLGRRVDGGSLAVLRDAVDAGDWFTDLRSFAWWAQEGNAPATPDELEIGALASTPREGLDGAPVVDAMHIGPGLMAARARAEGVFDAYTGSVGLRPALADDLSHPRSPTALQQWATCPFRYFLRHGLGLSERDEPADVETITPIDRGNLVHAVLEQYIQSRLDGDLDDDPVALLAIADEVEAAYRAQGRTGRAVLWDAEWKALRRHLPGVIDAQRDAERLAGLVPAAVEHGFGYPDTDAPAVEVDAGHGRVLRFGGRIDRVDRSPDGRRIVVLDYKTGRSQGYASFDEDDPVARGTRLQLPVYARAAAAQFPGADEVAAYYWFVGPGGAFQLTGGVVDDAVDGRFTDVVRTIVDGIEAGHFPARPGDEGWMPGRGEAFDNCRYCEYDRLCSSQRGEQWLHIRTARELAAYVELAEGDNHADDGQAES
jgi:RecB family exonuclease